jgi:broad specificity phosphatase PhoE
MNRLYFVRHGENPANLTKQFSHRKIDFPLNEKGRLQAVQTAAFFQDKDIHEIYASPLKRSMETAAFIAGRLRLSYSIVEGFREINVGELEEKPASVELWNIHNRVFLDWFTGKPDTCFPGGENYFSLWRRTQEAFDQITAGKSGRNLLVVGHAGMLTAIMGELCPQAGKDWLSSTNHNCAITEILLERSDGRIQGELVKWASYTHLHGKAAEFVAGFIEGDPFWSGPLPIPAAAKG